MSTHPTKLRDVASGADVDALLHDSLGVDDLFDAEETWAPARVRLLRRIRQTGLGASRLPESLHWNWARKAVVLDATRLNPLGDMRLFGISREAEWQGVLWGEICDPKGTEHTTRLGTAGRNLVYVTFVEVAPWNWLVPPDDPDKGKAQQQRFRGVGKQLMECAVRWSEQLGFHGRIGLHALPQADTFYAGCRMTDLGPDPKYHNLRYFEMEENQAKLFLKGRP